MKNLRNIFILLVLLIPAISWAHKDMEETDGQGYYVEANGQTAHTVDSLGVVNGDFILMIGGKYGYAPDYALQITTSSPEMIALIDTVKAAGNNGEVALMLLTFSRGDRTLCRGEAFATADSTIMMQISLGERFTYFPPRAKEETIWLDADEGVEDKIYIFNDLMTSFDIKQIVLTVATSDPVTLNLKGDTSITYKRLLQKLQKRTSKPPKG